MAINTVASGETFEVWLQATNDTITEIIMQILLVVQIRLFDTIQQEDLLFQTSIQMHLHSKVV